MEKCCANSFQLLRIQRTTSEALRKFLKDRTCLTWTEDNLLRQVSYQDQREDKPARPVVQRRVVRSGG